jgi:hypothetical protein
MNDNENRQEIMDCFSGSVQQMGPDLSVAEWNTLGFQVVHAVSEEQPGDFSELYGRL